MIILELQVYSGKSSYRNSFIYKYFEDMKILKDYYIYYIEGIPNTQCRCYSLSLGVYRWEVLRTSGKS